MFIRWKYNKQVFIYLSFHVFFQLLQKYDLGPRFTKCQLKQRRAPDLITQLKDKLSRFIWIL